MSGNENTSKETRDSFDRSNSFVRSLRRISSSVIRFLFRRDRKNAYDSDGSDEELPNIFRYPPQNSTDAFVVDDFERFQELLRETSEKTDTALNFFADSQKKNELDPSVWTVISEQQINRRASFASPPVLSKWKLKSLFKRREKNTIAQKNEGRSPWLPNSSQ